MSSKYVPSFLKQQHVQEHEPKQEHGQGFQRFSVKNNRFGALSDEFVAQKPATLASLTSTTNANNVQSKGGNSYANRLNKNFRQNVEPVPQKVVKEVNISSESDFPSLGGVSTKQVTTSTPKFAEFAKSWAKKIEEEEEKAKTEREQREKEKAEEELLRRTLKVVKNSKKKYDLQENYDYDPEADPERVVAELEGDEEYEVPSGNEDEGEFDEEDEENMEDEYNQDIEDEDRY